jgi:HEAT repeat protein
VPCLENKNREVRSASLKAVRRLAKRGSVNGIIKQLRHQDDGVRRTAAELIAILAENVDESAVAALCPCLEDRNGEVRSAVVKALARLAKRGYSASVNGILQRLRHQDD